MGFELLLINTPQKNTNCFTPFNEAKIAFRSYANVIVPVTVVQYCMVS